MRTVSCRFCHLSIDGKTWQRHMRRVHRQTAEDIKLISYFAIITIPVGTPSRRKQVHV